MRCTRRARRRHTAVFGQRGEAPARRTGSTANSLPRPIPVRRMAATSEEFEARCAPRWAGKLVRGDGGRQARLQKEGALRRRRDKAESDAIFGKAASSNAIGLARLVDDRRDDPDTKMDTWARVAGIRRGGGDDTDNDVTGQPRPGPALDPCSSTPKAGRISEHHGPQRGTAPTRTARPDQ